MKLSELGGRCPGLPLELELEQGQMLLLQTLLRVLPGQRYVGEAVWQGRKVLAKLLVGSKARRHFERELSGARLLAEQGLTTPELLAQGFSEGQGGWLLFDYLDHAESLDQAWREVENQALLSAGQSTVLDEALSVIAQLHTRGLWQDDLHLGNLLRHDGRLFVIDGGGVQAETPGQPLSRNKVLANLGVFFAQLPATLEPFMEELLVPYVLANPEHGLPLEALQQQVARGRQWRLRDYLNKVGRDCSLFSARVGAFGLRVVRRQEEQALQPLLDDLDSILAPADGERGKRPSDASLPRHMGAVKQGWDMKLLKAGGSATVARIDVQGWPVLLKRYNIKSFLHWCKRFWRPSRAWHSWREGHRLEHLQIGTPRPLAVVERRWCWLRGRRAFLLTDYLQGPDIVTHFMPYLENSPPEVELLALDRLFAALVRERISHGDLKGTNLLWNAEQNSWSMIDLDAMRQLRSKRRFVKAYARDRARFLRNWPADAALYRLLDQRLPRIAE